MCADLVNSRGLSSVYVQQMGSYEIVFMKNQKRRSGGFSSLCTTLGDQNEPDQQQAYQLTYTKYHSTNGSTKMKIAG